MAVRGEHSELVAREFCAPVLIARTPATPRSPTRPFHRPTTPWFVAAGPRRFSSPASWRPDPSEPSAKADDAPCRFQQPRVVFRLHANANELEARGARLETEDALRHRLRRASAVATRTPKSLPAQS